MSESEVLEKLKEGERLAVDALRCAAQRVSFDFTEVVPMFVHDTTINDELQARVRNARQPRSWHKSGWSLVLELRPDCRRDSSPQAALFKDITPDAVPVVICVAEKCTLISVPAAELLPPSDVSDLDLERTGEKRVTRRQMFWLLYFMDATAAPTPLLRRFQEAVRAAVAAELAKPGPKRALIDIIFHVAHGEQLEARERAGERITEADVVKALDVAAAS